MSALGAFGFSIIMKAPQRALSYILIGSIISATFERVLIYYTDEFISSFVGMVILNLYCEIVARVIKEPAAIILTPAVIPLLPGGAIYYTMYYIVIYNKQLFFEYGQSTLLTGLGISIGAVLSTIIVKLYIYAKKLTFSNKTKSQ